MLILAAGFLIAFAVVAVWFGIRWQLGDMFSEVTSPSDPQAVEIAQAAISYAPLNPRGYWLLGAALKGSFDDASLQRSIYQYEAAARVAPYRYTSWTELGRVNELAGRYKEAEESFLRAIEVAPEYTVPRWQIGNFYLRRGQEDEAIRELRSAAIHSSPYKVQVFSLAWNVFGNDPQRVEQFLTEDDDSKATLAYFYGIVNRPADALRIWNTIDADSRARFEWQVKALARDLYAHRSYRGALEFSRLAGTDPDARPEVITNHDFESPVRSSDLIRFDWRVNRSNGKAQVAMDADTAHEGKRSLKVTLRSYTPSAFNLLSQNIAVQPRNRYRLSFWLRTEELRSGGMPMIEVRNAVDDSLNSVTASFPTGTNPWQRLDVEFEAPTDGVYLTTAREPCSEECPITGIFWLDSFDLTRL